MWAKNAGRLEEFEEAITLTRVRCEVLYAQNSVKIVYEDELLDRENPVKEKKKVTKLDIFRKAIKQAGGHPTALREPVHQPFHAAGVLCERQKRSDHGREQDDLDTATVLEDGDHGIDGPHE